MALSARYHEHMLLLRRYGYGGIVDRVPSTGCTWSSQKERGHTEEARILGFKHLVYIRNQVKKRAGWTLFVASLLPPPFPFTAFVAAAAAFRYPRNKLLSFVGGARFIRFCEIEGALAVHYGH